ncbi:hypothetical protein BS636_15820 (plasmid) [Acinetobacter sp. LoGeW2-3]|uniref:hypothetical protein n=1 Tax=Acinetobacter sp. LoGeW2-3 TaxID=1808001 RepID=UPI000C059414|nr:hypothetical protein [Acinetobacter sp. LoGeW2-3]ATO21163.1 hypothetical protein BS636_15820 [Acinetobacter sp. LoGeW2-3]
MTDIENYLLQFVLPYCADDPDINTKVRKILKAIRLKNHSGTKLTKQRVKEKYIENWQAIFKLLKSSSSLRVHSSYMPIKILMMYLDQIIDPKLQCDCFQLKAKKHLDKRFIVNYFRLMSCKDFEAIQLNQMDSNYVKLQKPKELD